LSPWNSFDLTERCDLALEHGCGITGSGSHHTHQAERQLAFALHLEIGLFLLGRAADHP
jgi:hypothetical protein